MSAGLKSHAVVPARGGAVPAAGQGVLRVDDGYAVSFCEPVWEYEGGPNIIMLPAPDGSIPPQGTFWFFAVVTVVTVLGGVRMWFVVLETAETSWRGWIGCLVRLGTGLGGMETGGGSGGYGPGVCPVWGASGLGGDKHGIEQQGRGNVLMITPICFYFL